MTSCNNGFDTADLESAKTANRFEHYDEKISKLLDDKDSKKTKKKATTGSHLIFKAYLQERNIQNPATAEEFATVLLNALCVFRALEIF